MKTPSSLPLPILFLLISFGSVGAVLFTPALPTIQAFFGISVGTTQMTITSYLVGYALGQLPYGPLANAVGRKKTLYIGLTIAIIGSLLCALAEPLQSFTLLVAARFLQAMGACVGIKISFTMVADRYEGAHATKMLSKLMIAFAIMPGVAIALGGWITQQFNWQSCFYFLALFGLIMLGLATRLPETAKTLDRSVLNLRAVYSGYKEKFKNTNLILAALIMGCGTAVIYTFASKAPFIGISLLGLSPQAFGAYNLIPPAGMLIGSLLSTYLASRATTSTLLKTGILLSSAIAVLMLLCFLALPLSAFSLFIPISVVYVTESIVFANASSGALSRAKNKSNGSAVLNFINIGTSVVAVFLSGLIFPEEPILLPIFICAFFLLMWICYRQMARLKT